MLRGLRARPSRADRCAHAGRTHSSANRRRLSFAAAQPREAAAQPFGLDFIPLIAEDYYLVCLKDALDHPAVLKLRAALEGADALVIVTEWKEFRSPDFDNLKAKLKTPVIFDGRNLYDPVQVRGMGFEYLAIGR